MSTNPITVSIIEDSISPSGARLTTLVCTFHRFILSEVNTHRRWSRNSASSRAIPSSKLLETVRNTPAMPVFWGKNMPGMQAAEELAGPEKRECQDIWLETRDFNANQVQRLNDLGLHKQLCNRPLELWLPHTAIISSTEWENFYEQRISPGAQPEFYDLAVKIKSSIENSIPKIVVPGEYHLPFVSQSEKSMLPIESQIEISVGRCARVSYNRQGQGDIEENISLFQKLRVSKHPSPFEHIATPFKDPSLKSGNFDGWQQYRHQLFGK